MRRQAAVTLLVAASITYLLAALYPSGSTGDFIEYWAAGRAFLQGRNPYDAGTLLEFQRSAGWLKEQPLMMWNPPWTLGLVLPFAWLPFAEARLLWYLLAIAMVYGCAHYFWVAFGGDRRRAWMAWTIPVWYVPAMQVVLVGQITHFVLFGVAVLHFLAARRRDWLAGLGGLFVAVKPHLLLPWGIVLVLWALENRRWRLLASAAGSPLLVLGLLSVCRPQLVEQYLQSIRSEGPTLWLTPTVGKLLAHLTGIAALQFVPMLLGTGLAVVLWLRVWRGGPAWDRQLSFLLVLGVCSAAFAWSFDMVLLLPAVTQVMVRALRENRSWGMRWLLGTQVGLLAVLAWAGNNLYAVWLPWIILAMFLWYLGETIRRADGVPEL